MALRINTNVASLNAQRQLSRTNSSLARSFERLSSGLRVSSAKDDSAGLAISNRMSAQVRSLNQAVRNANDGISLVQTAESAMSESANLLERMRELTVQAANDTNTTSDRVSIQEEVDQLVSELNRIGNDTEFNSKTLLDGSASDVDFHIGANADQVLNVSLKDSRATFLGAQASDTSLSVATNADGSVSVDGTAISKDNGEISLNGVFIDDSATDGLAGGDATSAIAKAAAVNQTTGKHGVTASAEATTYTGGVVAAGDFALADMIINGVDIGAADGVLALDSDGRMIAAINAKSTDTGVTATVAATGEITLTAADGRNIDIELTDDGEDITLLDDDQDGAGDDHVVRGAVTLTSDEDIDLGGTTIVRLGMTANQDFDVSTADVVSGISVTTKAGANDALATIDRAISQVAKRRGALGAAQNRLESTISNLSAVAENTAAARSRIVDADFAKETAEMTRAQIVQQAGVAILAQANASPQTVLALLG